MNSVAIFGGGCFWCTEAVFVRLRGVIKVMSGYAGGRPANPDYESVSTGSTGHAEVLQIEFDPELISYQDLLEVFFTSHDPTTLNRQGNDIGDQYRSVIFYTTPEQKQLAEAAVKKIDNAVTEVKPLDTFYPAEDHHQNYYHTHRSAPYCQIVIDPKIAQLEKKFGRLLK